jgi:pre-mRNA-splicing factor SYF1
MLRIKRSVQASYNTESSFIAAQPAAAKSSAAADGGEKPTDAASRQARDAADPMAGLEREAGEGAAAGGKMRQAGAPSFVASTLKTQNAHGIDEAEAGQGDGANPEAIEIDEDDV